VRVPVLGLAALLVVVPWPGLASQQPGPADAPGQVDQGRRYQISVMEGVLERAAANGAVQTSRRFQAVMPEPLLWNGVSRARGFRLEGYGLFFDVEVPALRGSFAWSYQVLAETQDEVGALLGNEFRTLRDEISKLVTDPARRQQLDQTLQRIQVVVIGEGDRGMPPSGLVAARPARPPIDPNAAYTDDVKNSILEAMLDHSAPLRVAPDEWLTVAVSDSEPSRVVPGQPYDLMTITLRIKGSDLAALHAGRLSREEALKRVEVKEF